jgi:ATP-dependent DNA helicase RecQ
VLLHAFQDRFTHEYFIKSAYPERVIVERVYELLRRAADRTGVAPVSPSELAARSDGAVKEREVESALRLLGQVDAVRAEPVSLGSVWVRLLATPARIRAELGDGNEAERGLLRELWRGAGKRLYDGIPVEPEGLPPGFGGAMGVKTLLESLEERQFVVWHGTGGGLRLADVAAPLTRFAVDWEGLDRRRRAELSKLDAMQRYAYAKTCRRAFVLRYFGDPAARPTCDGCDVCLGTHVADRPTTPSRGASDTPRVRRRVRGDDARAAPAPAPAPAPVPKPQRTRAAVRTADVADELPELGPADVALIGALRVLRTELARAEHVPSYCIFPDRTLLEMAVRRPDSPDLLANVHGVGPAKLDRYGDRFLAVIRRAVDPQTAPS